MAKVLIITNNYGDPSSGGSPQSTLNLVNNINNNLIDVVVLDGRSIRKNAIDFSKFDNILIFGAWQNLFMLFLLIHKYREKIIFSPKGQHSNYEFNRNTLLKFIYFFIHDLIICFFSKNIILNSNLELSNTFVLKKLFINKIIIIPEFIHKFKQLKKPQLEEATLNIGIYAQFSKRKGLIQTLHYLKSISENKNYSLIKVNIAGEFKSFSKKDWLNLNNIICRIPENMNICFRGNLNNMNSVSEFIEDQDLIIINSMYESFCLALFEVAQHKTNLLIAKNIGGLEFIENNPKLHIYENDNFDDFKTSFEKAINSKDNIPYDINFHNLNVKKLYLKLLKP